jgi:DHA3 family macrolide efflux protein-like MFS transporter
VLHIAIFCLLFVSIPDVPRTQTQMHLFTDMKLGFEAMRANNPLMAVFFPDGADE